jgi:hypothetical protein
VFELQILIPVVDNANVAFTADDHVAFEAFVIDRFGGVTLYPAQAVGSWVDGGKRYDDRTRVYAFAVKSLVDGAKVGEVVAFAKSHYRQEAMYLRYLGLAEIL